MIKNRPTKKSRKARSKLQARAAKCSQVTKGYRNSLAEAPVKRLREVRAKAASRSAKIKTSRQKRNTPAPQSFLIGGPAKAETK